MITTPIHTRTRQALKVNTGGMSEDRRAQMLPVLAHYQGKPGFPHVVTIPARNDFILCGERNRIVPPEKAFHWLIDPRNELEGAWDSCLAAALVEIGYDASGHFHRHHGHDLLVGFEVEDDAFVFKLKFAGDWS